LIVGNPRSYGRFFPGKPSGKCMVTAKGAVPPESYQEHLNGETGLGLVPILDDDQCLWGAIDIDAHGDEPEVDLVGLETEVRSQDLPLMVCRSKSGGAHLYVFCSEPIPAKTLRFALSKWAAKLRQPGAEVFPKQDKLIGSGVDKQLGNWINLCYFDAESPDCLRFCVEGGKRIPLEYFVDLAESRRVSAAILVEKSEESHAGAPPCISRMLSEGVAAGYRNEALYSIAIYLKQAFPETWRDRAFDINARNFSKPLNHSEAKKVIDSVARRVYRYKCKEEPIRSLCNSSICVNRKFGITKEESSILNIGEHPEYGPLKKYMTDPVRWGLSVNGVEVHMTTSSLMDHRNIRESIAEKLTLIVPPMKADKWLSILQTVMSEAVIIDTPDEASGHGLVWQHLMQFLQRADLDAPGNDTTTRGMLLRGVPVVQLKGEERFIYFRGSDFVTYLRKNRAEELRGPNLWFALKEHGVTHGSLRIGQDVRQVWCMPVSGVPNNTPNRKPIKAEF